MKHFTDEFVSRHIRRIRTPYGVSMYLVEGGSRALLLDTGMGVGDLKTHAEEMTGLPLDVILSHGHCDHAGGSIQFERVWLSPADMALERTHNTKEHRIADVRDHFPHDQEFPEEEFLESRTESYEALSPGQVFDLGGVRARCIAAPGHTPGSVVTVIEDDNAAVVGDTLGDMALLHFPESSSVAAYLEMLRSLSRELGGVERLLGFHGSGELDRAMLAEMIELCERILDGSASYTDIHVLGYDGRLSPAEPGTLVSLLYNPARVKNT